VIIACLDCGDEAVVLFPGTEGSTSDLLDVYLSRPEPGFGLCILHAVERKWPNFPSEKPRVNSGEA
jgi:hypothetical protein